MNKTNDGQRQQGDVCFEVIDELPTGAEEVKGSLFAEGEGHHVHGVLIPDAVKFYKFNDKKYAKFLRDVPVEHVTKGSFSGGEHRKVFFRSGEIIEYGQVFEMDYLNEMARVVLD